VPERLTRSTVELAAMVRGGEVSARELVQASLDAIEAREPQINAFTHVAAESALRAADAVAPGDARPFAGVPLAVKDNRPVAGMPLTMCSDLWGGYVADHDAFLVRRLREAGFVIVGKTTLPENGILPTTESRRFGPTANPWALDRTPGGSSGGSGAAVASCRSLTATTAAARSGSRRRAAGWWGSSPRAAASRWAPTPATVISSATAC
jgi:amidase